MREKSAVVNGGDGGNRTRVQKGRGKLSTFIADSVYMRVIKKRQKQPARVFKVSVSRRNTGNALPKPQK